MDPALNMAGPDRKYDPFRSLGMLPEEALHSAEGSSSKTVLYPLAYALKSTSTDKLLLGTLADVSWVAANTVVVDG